MHNCFTSVRGEESSAMSPIWICIWKLYVSAKKKKKIVYKVVVLDAYPVMLLSELDEF